MTPQQYKAKFRCNTADKNLFSSSECLVTISVGQQLHEGEKLLQTFRLVNDAFASCIIQVDDTIQRFSIQLEKNLTPREAEKLSLKNGDEWLIRNDKAIRSLAIPYKIIRWDEWKTYSVYKDFQVEIAELIDSDKAFSNAIHETIDDYLSRKGRQCFATNTAEDNWRLCYDYLLEECVVFSVWAYANVRYEVYPSKRNKILTVLHQHFLEPRFPGCLAEIGVKFSQKPQLATQVF